jgi:DNA-binding transcriptional MocR family regulator
MSTKWSPSLLGFDGPKYMALLYALRSDIADGILKPEDRLPPVRELAWALQITPGTVARAYRKATQEGVLTAVVGRGTFVSAPSHADTAAIERSLLLQEDQEGNTDLRGSKNPQLGQDTEIQLALAHLAKKPVASYVLHPYADSDLAARQAACDWLQYTGIDTTPDDIALAYGAQNSVCLTLQTLLQGTAPKIISDELVFPGMRHAARLLRAEGCNSTT